MPIKRATLLKLCDLDRANFDNYARRDLLPWAHVPEPTSYVLRAEDGYAEVDPNIYTLRDAFQLVVALDLANSYWTGGADAPRRLADLAGASRIVANAWTRIVGNADDLAAGVGPDVWAFVVRSRVGGEDVEPYAIGSIGALVDAIEQAKADRMDPARILAVNLSASLRLLRARAAEHDVELPAGGEWIVKRI